MTFEKQHLPILRESARELQKMKKKGESLAHERWPLYDSSLRSFAEEFRSIVPGGGESVIGDKAVKLFLNYIGKVLRPDKNTHLVALEFGGPGIELFKGFPQHFFERTMGVCLDDTQNPIQTEDSSTKHQVIRGDLFKNKTYRDIETALEERKANLIISRMYGGLDEITWDPGIWARIARRWYSLLDETGLMFVQYRLATGEKWISKTEIQKDMRERLMREWTEFIQKSYGESLEIQLGDSAFRLRKKEGAPHELPILPSFDRTPVIVKKG